MVDYKLFFQNNIDEALQMYQDMHKWDEAIAVADAKVIIIHQYATIVSTISIFLVYFLADFLEVYKQSSECEPH